jgi:hypothetical protein
MEERTSKVVVFMRTSDAPATLKRVLVRTSYAYGERVEAVTEMDEADVTTVGPEDNAGVRGRGITKSEPVPELTMITVSRVKNSSEGDSPDTHIEKYGTHMTRAFGPSTIHVIKSPDERIHNSIELAALSST